MAKFSEVAARIGRYALSVPLILLAIGALVTGLFATAVVCLLLGLYFLPPLRDRVGLDPSTKVSGIVIVAGLIAFVVATGSDYSRTDVREQDERARLAAEAQAEREREWRNEFTANRLDILGRIRAHLEANEWTEARGLGQPYRFVGDEELLAVLSQAEEGILLERLREVPASDDRLNQRIYSELARLDPENQRYRERADHFTALLQEEARREREERERVQAERADRVAAWGEPPTKSAWDGTYREVQDYLRQVAHDPGSIDIDVCTDVYRVQGEGWLVGCDYRGRNAFGALIRNSHWFIIRHGRVVDMKEASAYSP